MFVLVILAAIVFGIATFLFLKAAWLMLKALTVRLWPEKWMDRHLFKMWKKKEDYKMFEDEMKKAINE